MYARFGILLLTAAILLFVHGSSSSTANGQEETVDSNGAHTHGTTDADVEALVERVERLERAIRTLNGRLDTQGKYIQELRKWQQDAVKDVPQTNEDYARMFSRTYHEHGILQASLYTYVFNANRGRSQERGILPRNYDFELPEAEPNPFPPPVVN